MYRKKTVYLAPMVGWSTPLFREFIQVLNYDVVTFTEMVVAKSLIYGKRYSRLRVSGYEGRVICQLAGSCPNEFALCADEKQQYAKFDEINLNVGCPSLKVQNGLMGACMMKDPHLVNDCLEAMKLINRPISVKCRIGVDNQNFDDLCKFIDTCKSNNSKFYIHARYALLNGINPKQNRSVPKIDYETVRSLSKIFPDCDFVLNGEINTAAKIRSFLQDDHFSGVMVGRSAYQNPWIFTEINQCDMASLIKRLNKFLFRLLHTENRDAEWLRVLGTLTHGLPRSKSIRRDIINNRMQDLSKYEDGLTNSIEAMLINRRCL